MSTRSHDSRRPTSLSVEDLTPQMRHPHVYSVPTQWQLDFNKLLGRTYYTNVLDGSLALFFVTIPPCLLRFGQNYGRGLKKFNERVLWFHIPDMATLPDTANMPSSEIGN